jgi:NADP-dependent 3-hydroxy acid dehydrogenase YdfG
MTPPPNDGPVLLITGASSGIGAATARHAAGAGWRLVLGARSEERLGELAGELGGDDRAVAGHCDVTRFAEVESLVAAGLDRFGRLDAVFANAGVGARRGFLRETVDHWRSMVETNVLGVAYTIRAALPHLAEAGRGHFVLTGSVAGRRPLPGSLYAATKFAVTAIAEGLRQEIRHDMPEADIRVTLIAPGMVDTPFFDRKPEDALRDDDVARAVLYALEQPPHVDVNELLLRPVRQAT